MLKKTERLQRSDFATFFKKGKRFHSEHYTVVFAPFPTFHASVVVSKKVSKLAVMRNTYRRRIYAQLYNLKQQQSGVYIVVLKPTCKNLTRKEAQIHLNQLIERIVKPA